MTGLEWFEHNIVTIGVSFSFAWSVFQWVDARRREQRVQEFGSYHKLIEDLVSPKEKDGPMFVDRQIAIVFELRYFDRYFELMDRMLTALRATWGNAGGHKRLLDEMDLTLTYIRKRK